ncbi:unnamed protein product [Symbiodinium microadriaticum]|nr:unnamed protein product [Symbiodinium microadriaticum]
MFPVAQPGRHHRVRLRRRSAQRWAARTTRTTACPPLWTRPQALESKRLPSLTTRSTPAA